MLVAKGGRYDGCTVISSPAASVTPSAHPNLYQRRFTLQHSVAGLLLPDGVALSDEITTRGLQSSPLLKIYQGKDVFVLFRCTYTPFVGILCEHLKEFYLCIHIYHNVLLLDSHLVGCW